MIEYFDYTLGDGFRVRLFLVSLMYGGLILTYAGWWDWRVRRVPNWIWILGSFPVPAFLLSRDWIYDLLGLPFVVAFAVVMRLRSRWGSGDSKAVLWSALVMGPLPAILGILLTAIWIHFQRLQRTPVVTYYAGFTWGVNIVISITFFIIKV